MHEYAGWMMYSIMGSVVNAEKSSGTGLAGGIILLGGVVLVSAIVWICKGRERKGVGTEVRLEQGKGREADSKAGAAKVQTPGPEARVSWELQDKLLQTEKRLWEAEAAAPYEKLFEGMVLPLQKLLGLAHCPWHTMTEEKVDYYIWDVVINPLLDVVKKAKGKIEQGNLLLPEPEKRFEEEKIRQSIQKLSVQQMEQYIRENKLQISSREIVFQKTGAVRELGIVVKMLEGFATSRQVTEEDLGRQAQKVQSILEKHGIYPMFAKDSRLNPALKKRFSPVNEYSMKYPGLFIRREGHWEVLGSNIGMDDDNL